MGWRSLLKMLVFALLAVSLGACDAGAPTPAPTAAPFASTPTISALDATPEGAATAEEIEVTATPEGVDNPTPESEGTVQPPTLVIPTISLQSPLPPLPPLPDGPLTVVALGDSQTEGDADWPGEGGGYPARLKRSLNELRPGSQVINLGKSGWNSQQMVEAQLPDALQAKPHIALVWIGANDIWNNNGPGEGEAQDLTNYTNHIDTTLRSLRGAGARVFIALMDDQAQRPYSKANYGPEQLAHMTRLDVAFNDIIRAKAAEYGATVLDFYNTTLFTDPATLAEDGIHSNPKGYDAIAQMWFEALRPILSR